jgi:uncharacterized Ntn-hydrolase superfamily protein
MKNLYSILAALVITFSSYSQDTFSIIAVDPATGEIGSAGASCVQGFPQGIIDLITDIIPGRGGVNSQAVVCIPNTNLQNAIIQMEAGASPTEIIDWLLLNDDCGTGGFNPEYRQYGIADFDVMGVPRTAGWTGNLAQDYKEDRQGANYSVQGNILLNQTVIDNMEANFNNTMGTLADKLMAALQGANFPGADNRCLAAGTSSTTAYMLVYKEDDDPNDPYIRLNVGQQPSGVEPIDILQDLYDQFLRVENNDLISQFSIFPNPAKDKLHINYNSEIGLLSLDIYNIQGKKIKNILIDNSQVSNQELNIKDLKSGLYFLRVGTVKGTVSLKFVKE